MIGCFGEAVIDFFPEPGTRSYEAYVGGSPANVARFLGRLGTTSAFIGAVSTDQFGSYVLAELERCAVDTSRVVRLEYPTSIGFVGPEEGATAYRFYAEKGADRHFFVDAPEAVLEGLDAAHFGSNALALAPGDRVFCELLRLASRTMVVLLDPNVRPGLVGDPDEYRSRLRALFRLCDIVKLSEEDAAFVYPDKDSFGALSELSRSGPVLAVLTRGDRGARYVLAGELGELGELDAPRVAVLDTVGAGDAFSAGLLAGLFGSGLLEKGALRAASSDDLAGALRRGVALGAASCTRRGAVALTSEEVDAALL